ncbi:radical SAM protein [Prosthecochloris sp. SCSIO W1103]|uniref:radical SAM protein n=1 Tax=Prosthecochloris sp. SCSIO W1103 TaxID=2992244 RepID=UPI00223E8B1F|nr:radical SAM protein [Prosthecochloris sp. SCSIO W1103]UZJ38177.1 radical SAM protein [Prosthecochloris sp. SCSIO W1103]
MKRYFIFTLGCVDNQMDSALYKKYLDLNGWINVDDYSTADLILINTCGFLASKMKETEDTIKKTKEKISKNSKLVICGCYPALNPKRLSEFFEGDFFTPLTKYKIKDVIGSDMSIYDINDINTIHPIYKDCNYLCSIKERFLDGLKCFYSPDFIGYTSDLCYIRTGVGCMGECSYCGIKKARGKIKSKPLDNILFEFKDKLNRGEKRFVLSGLDIGAYGRDIGLDVLTLLDKILSVEGDYKICIRNFEPMMLNEMMSGLLSLIRTRKIISITIPFQSGSDKVLKLMKRNYDIEMLKFNLNRVRVANPAMILLTHVLVGFPGEDDNDFKKTLEFLECVLFDSIQLNVYTPHHATEAAYMSNQVSETIKLTRANILKKKIYVNMLKSYMKRASYQFKGIVSAKSTLE